MTSLRTLPIAIALGLLGTAASAAPALAQATSPEQTAAVDAVFERFTGADTPGCAVAVSRDGRPILERAYGMADLEHDVSNTPETVFEAGSVSKQFTATATILLALEGRLSLDDDVRKHIPELPEYERPVTIRQLINHTSGLRDWGSVAAIEGWPRTRRMHTHQHMLDIAARQKALNYTPGQYYSYTNTGYNLQAVLVERITGKTFQEFSQERIFGPLGLTKTQWRDDYTEVVEDRASGYAPVRGGGWREDMPFENVHGNGGLLTTVGDLLRWTQALETAELGEAWKREMHRQGVLNDGTVIDYASGLVHGERHGHPEVSHGGATAGYRAYLTRFPGQRLGVALLCNAANANPGALAYGVSDVFLPAGAEAAVAGAGGAGADRAGIALSAAALEDRAGFYRDTRTQTAFELAVRDGKLVVATYGAELTPLSDTEFSFLGGQGRLVFDQPSSAAGRSPFSLSFSGDATVIHVPEPAFEPTPEQLRAYVGTYRSDEAEATYTIAVEDGKLVLKDRYGDASPLTPTYPDAFASGPYTFRFLRDKEGRIRELSGVSSRVWDIRFRKVAPQ